MGAVERVTGLVQPMLPGRDLTLYDVEHAGGVLRVTVQRAGDVERPGEVDLGILGDLTRELSRALDDEDPLPGRYTLEVSSPGLERRLRTPAHFAGAVGTEVSVKMSVAVDGQRRFDGNLTSADEVSIRVDDGPLLPLADIDKARTVFRWGPTPKPGAKRSKRPSDRSDNDKTTSQRERA